MQQHSSRSRGFNRGGKSNSNRKPFKKTGSDFLSSSYKPRFSEDSPRSNNAPKSNFRGGGNNRRFNNNNRPRRNFGPKTKINHTKYIYKVEQVTETIQYESGKTFADFNLQPALLKNLTARGYDKPTQIQDDSIDHALEGRDVLGIAQTGTGKTGAFLIPLVNKIIKDKNQKVLIIAPTRELALQIQDEMKKLTPGLGIYSASVIGGANMYRQISDLRRRPNFVIGTPGRLKDLYQRKALNFKDYTNIVLDEVDRMLDMGFVNDIKDIIRMLPEQRQTLFFSATIDRATEDIANQLLKNPIKIQVEAHSSSKNVEQDIVRVESHSHKIETLHNILITEEVTKTIIFARTKHGSDRLSKELQGRGFKVDAIHGDKTQAKRSRVITDFKQNRINVLVATDVAARGIDIPDVSHVINYDEPATYEDYIHRIGRTGRYGKKGKALTFV